MKILCAVDGSRYSRWALEALQRLNFAPGSTLFLLHAVDAGKLRPSAEADATTKEALRQGLRLAEAGGRKLLARAEAVASSQWSSVSAGIVRGDPAHAIVRTAASRKCDVIVVGSRGLTEFRPFLLGSVSRRVVMEAPCSVLVVKKRITSLGRIVIGVDGSRGADKAVEFLLRLPLPKEARITALSVIPPLPIETSSESETPAAVLKQVRSVLEREAQKVAKQAAERIRNAGFDATAKVSHGHVGYSIIELARSIKADLAVVGARGLNGTTRYLMGSVSDAVVKYAPCSVLVVRR